VTAANPNGESPNSSEVSATPAVVAAARFDRRRVQPPGGFDLVCGLRRDGYVLKRSYVSGSGYTVLVTNLTTTYADNNVTNGSTYYYVASAFDGLGDQSLNSAEASATLSVPSTPANLTALGLNGSGC